MKNLSKDLASNRDMNLSINNNYKIFQIVVVTLGNRCVRLTKTSKKPLKHHTTNKPVSEKALTIEPNYSILFKILII